MTQVSSKIVMLFNDEHEYSRWNDTLTALLSGDRVFSRGALCCCALYSSHCDSFLSAIISDPLPPEAAQGSDSKAWQDWQQVPLNTSTSDAVVVSCGVQRVPCDD